MTTKTKNLNLAARLKEELDIVTEIEKRMELKKSGDNYLGFCPFHANTNTPALTVYPETNSWYCYGCAQGGDVLTFIQKFERDIDFGEMIKSLAKELGIRLRAPTIEEMEKEKYHNRLYGLLLTTATFFHQNLIWSEVAAGARTYLEKRNIQPNTLTDYIIGYAPDSWSSLYHFLKNLEYTDKEMLDVGVIKEGGGGLYDRFRNRIMFPIRTNGHIIGFGGRQLGIVRDKTPKYINSPSTLFFSKKESLYGISYARESIKERNGAVVVEGYMDVLALHQAGYTNAVGIMGTSLTAEQATVLSHHTNRITMALDPDEAGDKAIERLKLESLANLDIYIASLPSNKDPDEIVSVDPELWEEILYSAKPIPIYMTDYYIKKYKPRDPKDKRKIVNRMRPIINSVRDVNEQVGYQQYLAEALGYKNYELKPVCPNCGEKHA